jgi:hypothetical protein
MNAVEVTAFLSHLAVERTVSASTQNQAKAALLFLYKQVLQVDLPWLEEVVVAHLLCGTGMRLLEGQLAAVKSPHPNPSPTTWARGSRPDSYPRPLRAGEGLGVRAWTGGHREAMHPARPQPWRSRRAQPAGSDQLRLHMQPFDRLRANG